jgi:acetolactate synthase-1/2/3 large subunit
VEPLRTALLAAHNRQGPTLIEIDQARWMMAVAQ